MYFSYRRLRWSALSLLLVCLLLLTPATRQVVDRILISQLLGPDVSIGKLVVHGKHSILEIRDLNWTPTGGQNMAQLTAQQGWIAVDQQGLLDRHAKFPLVILQDVDLRLEQAPIPEAGLLVHWKRRLAQYISELDWKQVQQQLGCLTATQDVQRSFTDRIDRWLLRSQEILSETKDLQQQSAGMNNPLRFEISLKEKLARVRELATEQHLVAQQFETLDAQLLSETVRLQSMHQQDQHRLAGLVIGNAAERETQLEIDQICVEVAHDLGQALWLRLAPYGEVVDQLSEGTRSSARRDYDIDVRSARWGNERLAVQQWKGTGTFRCGDIQSPFRASGDWILSQEALSPRHVAYGWEAIFQHAGGEINIQARHDSHHASATQLILCHTQISATPDSLGARESHRSSSVEPLQTCSQMKLTSEARQLEGELVLVSHSLPWLSADQLLDLTAVAEENPPQPLRFELEGDWSQVRLKAREAIPVWLAGAVAAEFKHRMHLAATAQQSELERAFSAQMAALRDVVAGAKQQTKSKTLECEQQLIATQQHLQQQIDRIDGLEYARRPDTIVR